MPAPLPTPRGTLTEALSDCFRGRGVARSVEADSHDDAALALWMLYELHHRGFDEVDDALEWDPALLAVRADLEHDLEERWRDRARALAQPAQDRLADGEDFAELFFDLCAADTGGESLARFVQREAEEEQVLALLRQRSIYHVREQDSAMWALPRLDDETKAHLVAIAADEYGNGHPDHLHAELWRRGMAACGLDTGYAAYVDEALPEVLEQNNLMSMLGLHRRLVPAALGHLAAFEVCSSVPSKRMVRGLERLGMPEPMIAYYREHMVADAVHEQVAVRRMLGGWVSREPHVADDALWGAAVCLAAEQETATAVLASARAESATDHEAVA
ncbi:iron-containing redox enzyme family protein [uncultured Nocardioides sp.]|uniref:iron-containing redox enzyme family protein n=1 Tax=uncultured Nocardioides sp. TaxID=198441 RepID=UPI0026023E9C|nr:iron-containing redox enzyme family protein [uncultured Nocardioides sp.]